ncbi:unnamed protein product, partial [Candidula unifasciata]
DADDVVRRRRIAGAVHGKVAAAFRARSARRLAAAASPSPGPSHPQSQSFSRSYGSNLPTSLTYIVRLEAVHLGDLLRIWVRPGTKFTPSPWGFQGPTEAHRTPQEPRCFTEPRSLSPGKPIPGMWLLTKKRELFPGLPPTSPTSFALPHVAPEDQSPCPGSGILTRFPFDRLLADSENER